MATVGTVSVGTVSGNGWRIGGSVSSNSWSIGGSVSNVAEVTVVRDGAGMSMTVMGSRRVVHGSSVNDRGMDDRGMDDWGNSVSDDCRGSVHGMRMDGRCGLGDDCVETVHIIGRIVDGTDRTVGLDQRVLSLDDITVAHLMLGFDVAGVSVGYAIVERVLWVGVLQRRDRERE